MSIIVIKKLLYGEMPSFRDSTVLLLLAIHFVTFMCFHTMIGKKIIDTLIRSPYRRLFQETFKGYGKASKLLNLVHKGLSREISEVYFIWLLVIRVIASSIFK